MLICYIIHYSLASLLSYTLCKSGGRIVVRLRNDVYKKAQYLPMKFYDKTATGQVINRIGGDTATIQNFIINIARDAVNQLILLFGIIVIMAVMNWKLTLISLIPGSARRYRRKDVCEKGCSYVQENLEKMGFGHFRADGQYSLHQSR